MKIGKMNVGQWGKVRAFFDVQTVDGFAIKGFKIVEGINGVFVGLPSEEYKDENGDKKYRYTVWMDKGDKNNFDEFALNHYHELASGAKRNTAEDAPKSISDEAKKFEKYNPYNEELENDKIPF